MARLLVHKSTHPAQLLDTVVAACDWLQDGFLITRDSGQLLFANDAAAQILRARDGLALRNGQLVTELSTSPSAESAVGDFAALLATARTRNGLIVAVPRPSGRLPLTLTLRPARMEPASATDCQHGTMLVLIHDPERAANAGPAGLRELYGLTTTEARLASFIMQGNSTDDCTGLLGIRRTTVKMHLRNLYGKTGVRRQSELVALLFTSFGGLRGSLPAQPTLSQPAGPRRMGTAGSELDGAREAC